MTRSPAPTQAPSSWRRMTDPAIGLVGDLVGPALRVLNPTPGRRTSGRAGRTHVEMRGMGAPDQADARRAVVEELRRVEGVHDAVVNAVLGRVVVDHASHVGIAELVAVVTRVEAEYDLQRAQPDTDGSHPAEVTPWVRQVVALSLDLAGLGVVGVERFLTTVPITSAVPTLLTAGLSLADAVPASRTAFEEATGSATTESWFSVGSATVQAIGRGPLGLVVDACYRAIRADEAAARNQSWAAFDDGAPLEVHESGPVETGERPVALRRGPVEQVGDLSGAAALAAFGVARALVPERSAEILLAGVPKASRWGREAYVSSAHRALADGGVVIVDPAALRRADRVDVVVLSEDLAQDRVLADAASSVGRLVIVDGGTAQAVTRLQEAGHGVALVSAGDAEGLAAADVGIGIGDEVPWTAALRCVDRDQARATLTVVAGARAASWRAAALALVGSAAGAPIALTSSLVGLGGRVNTPVTLAAFVSIGVNAWAGRVLGRGPIGVLP